MTKKYHKKRFMSSARDFVRNGGVPKVMSVALIEPFDRWFLSLSKGSGTARRNDCYTKCGGFDKLNHRNANLLDSPFSE